MYFFLDMQEDPIKNGVNDDSSGKILMYTYFCLTFVLTEDPPSGSPIGESLPQLQSPADKYVWTKNVLLL